MAGVCPRITTYPPVGSVTVLEPGQTNVSFTAVIEWERDRAYPFDFKLLYSDASRAQGAQAHPSSWTQVPLPRSSDSPSRIFTTEQACRLAAFTTTLTVDELSLVPRGDGSLYAKFTVQYQHYPGSPFKTLSNSSGAVAVAEVIIPAGETSDKYRIENLITLDAGWSASQLAPLRKDASAYRVTSSDTIPQSQTEDTVLTNKNIGSIVDQLRFMCIIRAEPFWYGAVHDGEYFHLSEHAIMCSFLTQSGVYVTLLAFNGTDDFYQVFTGGPEGKVTLAGRNDSPSDASFGFIATVAGDRQDSIAEAMEQARGLVETTPKVHSMLEKAIDAANGTTEGPGDDFFDNLGYCTWNGIGQDLTADKIFSALQKLSDAGVVFNTLLIDDNWQTLGNTKLDPSEPGWRGWARFKANDEGFPDGLSGMIREVKARFPHIQYVGVWHAILGYWAGLSHDTELAKTYKLRMTRCKVRLSITTDVLVVDPVDVHRMYDDFYGFLRSEGVDFIKTDVQHLLSMFLDPKDRQDIPAAYQSAWTVAYLKHFQGRAIGCMSQIPQITFHSLLQSKTPKILVRNNDDFFPEIPGSHPLHIFTNAHNALLTQHLNALPDWDMFQTSHAYSSYHGAARAISGGPVLITDTPGEHSLELINQMTATTPSGKQIALRPAVATALDFFNSYATGPLLKVATSTTTGSGIIGCFNAGEGEREALIPYSDFQRAAKSKEKLVVRSFRTGQVLDFISPLARLVKMRLEPRGWDILTASPLIPFGSRRVPVAVLGLLDKMSGAAGVTKVEPSTSEYTLIVELKALGNLGMVVGDVATPLDKVFVENDEVDGKYMSSTAYSRSGYSLFSVDIGAWWKDERKRSEATTVSVKICFGQKKLFIASRTATGQSN